MKGNFTAIVLILIGALALGVNLDLFEIDFVRPARTWWPVVLIALGASLLFTPGDGDKSD